ncbi:MAG: ABC-type transport auxiliary lipoprotein family protein [Victivallaceae bacterium]|jgi:ABC-type uncharacterized transport system auxiliary subunit
MKNILLIVLSGVLSAVMLTGCLFREAPYNEVGYFDLSNPEKILPDGAVVKVNIFKNIETGKYKMVYRNGESKVIVDEYNKWVQPPDLMISRYLQAAFSDDKITSDGNTKTEFEVSGTVFMFIIDLKSKKAALGVSYRITRNQASSEIEMINNSCVLTSNFEKENPADFAKSMSVCADLLAKRLKTDIDFLMKKESTVNTAGRNKTPKEAKPQNEPAKPETADKPAADPKKNG